MLEEISNTHTHTRIKGMKRKQRETKYIDRQILPTNAIKENKSKKGKELFLNKICIKWDNQLPRSILYSQKS